MAVSTSSTIDLKKFVTITMTEDRGSDPLNTVAVVPFDLPLSTSNRGGSTSSSNTTSSLAAAASNLISAIAQGSTSSQVAHCTRNEEQQNVDSDDEGSSSFTYTAPATSISNTEVEQTGWYASTPYHISNRYYDVDITLKATKSALVATASTVSCALSETFPAYLVVVDRSRPLDHHRLVASSLESKVASGFDADISIVAGVSLITASHHQLVTHLDDGPSSPTPPRTQQGLAPAKTSDLVALYADYGWEFIAIDETDDDELDLAQSNGSDDGNEYSDGERDLDGIERIREALMNHVWNGLVRKEESHARTMGDESRARAHPASSLHPGFSDSLQLDVDDTNDDLKDRSASNTAPHDANAEPTPSSLSRICNEDGLPSLGLDTHAEASDLDEQLAKLFLASSNGASGSAGFAELEAFLESEDPSWPAPLPTESSFPTSNTATNSETFEDDFDDFLPFQSASSNPAASVAREPGTGDDKDDLPSMSEISSMQHRLFGANAASRLEAGPLGMGQPNPANNAGQDLASQLQQLQWHAQRVRGIQDPDQRRKEATLVALAFSMQWSNDDDDVDQIGAMNF